MENECIERMNDALMDRDGIGAALAAYEARHHQGAAAELLGMPAWPNTPGDVGARLCLETETDNIVDFMMWQGTLVDDVLTFNEGTISLIPTTHGVRIVGAVDEHYIDGRAGRLISYALEAIMECAGVDEYPVEA